MSGRVREVASAVRWTFRKRINTIRRRIIRVLGPEGSSPSQVVTYTPNLRDDVHAGDQPASQEDGDLGWNTEPNSARHSSHRRGSCTDNKTGTTVVELTKKEGSGLGLVVSGGQDKNERPRVAYLRPGGIAHRSDALEVGDFIVAVNGIRTTSLRHDQIVSLLKNASEGVVLELEYELPDPPQTTFSVLCKRVEVQLEKDGNTFGFTLRGGAHPEPTKSRPLTITQIRRGSSADREGTLKVGDRILSINGVNMSQVSLLEAGNLLKHADHVITLLVEYDVSVMEAVQNATGPLLVEIDKTPGASLGITLCTRSCKGKPTIQIDTIRPASIADRCGALHVGDQILSIDDASLEHMTIAEASQLLKCSVGEQIRLEILPVGPTKCKPQTDSSRTVLPPVTNGMSTSGSYNSFTSSHSSQSQGSGFSHGYNSMTPQQVSAPNSGYNTASSQGKASSKCSSSWGQRDDSQKYSTISRQGSLSSNTSGVLSLPPGQHVCHPETMEVLLVADHKGFGLVLAESPFCSQHGDILIEPPVISHIEPKSAAERSGVLQEGDRILAIDGQYLENLTLGQANEMLRDAGGRVALHVEFDIADSIVPSSGVFNIKVCKRGSGLGITISSPSNRQPGEPLILSDVKKGSVAHRTGTIQPGDRLLAIDNVRLDNCTIEDAAEILQNTDDIVKLKIKKDEWFADEPDPNSYISYTVELQKLGGPLGITIAGSEEPFDPIYISGLTEGGLAQKTGALHVGDRILAINGQTLRGKPLSDAISHLQNSSDTVTLKISRPSNARRSGSKAGDSVDSALESWDSSGLGSNNNEGGKNSTGGSSQSTNKSSSQHNNSDHDAGSPPPSRHIEVMPKSGTYDDLSNELRIDPSEDDWDTRSRGGSQSVPSSADQDLWSRSVDNLDRLAYPDMVHHSDNVSLNSGYYCDRTKRENSQKSRTKPPSLPENPDNIEELSDIGSMSTSTRMGAELHLQEVEQELQNIFTPTPVELHRVTLYKWHDTDDFGFSLSDGVYEKGVYISAVRPNGPADKSGNIRPFDRLLQINDFRVRELECKQVVPLIAEAGKMVDLVVSRNPLAALLDVEGRSFDDAMSDIWKPQREIYRPQQQYQQQPRLRSSSLRVQTV